MAPVSSLAACHHPLDRQRLGNDQFTSSVLASRSPAFGTCFVVSLSKVFSSSTKVVFDVITEEKREIWHLFGPFFVSCAWHWMLTKMKFCKLQAGFLVVVD
jgi:hypothetical protein